MFEGLTPFQVRDLAVRLEAEVQRLQGIVFAMENDRRENGHKFKNPGEAYAAGIITEECGECLKAIGKAERFGVDTPGVIHPVSGAVDMTITPRTQLTVEAGDLLAAVAYACQRGLIDANAVMAQRDKKLAKLLDPLATDNLGRRLAP